MAMKVFNVGDVLAAADVNEYLVNTKLLVKPGDTTRSSTATLANDPDLTIAVDANKSYDCVIRIQYNSGATPNFKTAFSVPASATFNGYAIGTQLGSPNTLIAAIDANFAVTGALPWAGGNDISLTYSGILATAGTAGNFTFQWAQNTSNASSTIVRAGSSMLLRRCA